MNIFYCVFNKLAYVQNLIDTARIRWRKLHIHNGLHFPPRFQGIEQIGELSI
jgi:hypothetical protein